MCIRDRLGTYNSDADVNEKAVTQRILNNLLLSAGGSIGTSGGFKLRIIGKPSTQLSSSTNGVSAVSNEVTITATPYDTFDEFERLYVPGGYQSASGYGNDWSPDNAVSYTHLDVYKRQVLYFWTIFINWQYR